MVVKSTSIYESGAANLERHNENPILLPNEDTVGIRSSIQSSRFIRWK
jgi:hypothetical protein